MEYLSLFNELKARKMSLDLTRGKPGRDQLDLSSSIDSVEIDIYDFDEFDIRNYGQVKGLSECKEPVSYTHLTLPTIYSV